MKYLLLFISFLIVQQVLSDNSIYKTYSTRIESVPEDGYYNLELSQEIVGLSAKDFSDIRLYDQNKNEIPYFVRSESPVQEINRFVGFHIIRNTTKENTNTIIIENRDKELLNRFYIVTRSADVKKEIRLRGTNNMPDWYIVRQEHDITYGGFKQDGYDILVLDFPQGDYRYYEITLTNNQDSPLEVLNVVKIENSHLYAQLTQIQSGEIIQKDSTDKNTYIHFYQMEQPYRISQVIFEIDTNSDYLRSGYIYPGRERFTLSSQTENIVRFDQFVFRKDGYIVIENRDNLPLKIKKVELYGLNRFLCAYLEAGNSYSLEIDPALRNRRPDYDIIHFSNQITDTIPILQTSALISNRISPEIIPARDKMWIEKPVVLWSIICLSAILLTFICLKMIREMKRRN